MSTPQETSDTRVRVAVYRSTIAVGLPPTAAELATSLDLQLAEIRESLERLAAARALVLQATSREILMANPFSAVPTPYAVRAGERLYYGNCIWDALGIPAMLRVPARIHCSCACCGEAMSLAVRQDLVPTSGVVHFALPASRWWDDIVYN
jgi:Alkylmercury lyase